MCGIAGVAGHSWTGKPQLERMLATLRHRGPDDQGVWLDEEAHAGFAATRLAIQDVSHEGHQPMRSLRSGNIVCLNGEIYNSNELRNSLVGLGHSFRGTSDTEVLLAAHDQWGSDCLQKLRGMFAFAIWLREERTLFLARDRLGIKPLYYVQSGENVAFASEVRTLLAGGYCAPTLSIGGLSSYLHYGGVQEPLSIFDGVHALPPGHLATWTAGRFKTRSYWSITDVFGPLNPVKPEDALAELSDALKTAVKLHLVSDVPLGVFLSGGVDSSALVALASTAVEQPIRTCSLVFPQPRYSEQAHSQLIARTYGTGHVQCEVSEADIIRQIPDALTAMDQPTVDGVNTYLVSKVARQEAGLTVALSGIGGDELFGGYHTFRATRRLLDIAQRTPRGAGRLASGVLARLPGGSDRRRKMCDWLREGGDAQAAYQLQRQIFGPLARQALMPAAVAVPADVPLGRLPSELGNATSVLELSGYMRNVLLRDSDVMSMANSLELRVPFLDHRLVELVAALPASLKFHAAEPKSLLVNALDSGFPAHIVKRSKMGFELPFDVWMRGVLRARIEERLLDKDFGGQVAQALDPAAVRAVWTDFLAGRTSWSRPWSLMVLKSWGDRLL